MLIYRALNTVTGKSYIGLTTLTLGQRKHKHWLNSKDPSKHKGRAIYHAINKYGWDSFQWHELATADTVEQLVQLEKDFISLYDSYNNGYNNTTGGDGVQQPRKLETYIVKYPDQSVHVVTGYKKFCREHNLNEGNLWHTYQPYKRTYTYKSKGGGERHYTYWMKAKSCKGYVLLGKFNDYLGTEYTTLHLAEEVEAVDSSVTNPTLDDDIV